MLRRSDTTFDNISDLSAEGLNVSHFDVCRLLGGMMSSAQLKEEESKSQIIPEEHQNQMIASGQSKEVFDAKLEKIETVYLLEETKLIDITDANSVKCQILTKDQFEKRYNYLVDLLKEDPDMSPHDHVNINDYKTFKMKTLDIDQFSERLEFLENKERTQNEEIEYLRLLQLADLEEIPEEPQEVVCTGRKVFAKKERYFVDLDKTMTEEEQKEIIKYKKDRIELNQLKELYKNRYEQAGYVDVKRSLEGSDAHYSILFPTEETRLMELGANLQQQIEMLETVRITV